MTPDPVLEAFWLFLYYVCLVSGLGHLIFYCTMRAASQWDEKEALVEALNEALDTNFDLIQISKSEKKIQFSVKTPGGYKIRFFEKN